MIAVRLLLVAATLFCHWANCADKTHPGQIIPPAAETRPLFPNAISPSRQPQQRYVPPHKRATRISSPASSSSSSQSKLPQKSGLHLPTQGIGETNSASDGWRIWKYECNDLPLECPRCKKITADMLQDYTDASRLRCSLCKKFWNLHSDHNVSVFSPERWPKYIKSTETVFPDVPNLFDALKASKFNGILWPAKMGEMIKFNRQVGSAIFREGFAPDFKDASMAGHSGGYFSLAILTYVGKLHTVGYRQ